MTSTKIYRPSCIIQRLFMQRKKHRIIEFSKSRTLFIKKKKNRLQISKLMQYSKVICEHYFIIGEIVI